MVYPAIGIRKHSDHEFGLDQSLDHFIYSLLFFLFRFAKLDKHRKLTDFWQHAPVLENVSQLLLVFKLLVDQIVLQQIAVANERHEVVQLFEHTLPLQSLRLVVEVELMLCLRYHLNDVLVLALKVGAERKQFLAERFLLLLIVVFLSEKTVDFLVKSLENTQNLVELEHFAGSNARLVGDIEARSVIKD